MIPALRHVVPPAFARSDRQIWRKTVIVLWLFSLIVRPSVSAFATNSDKAAGTQKTVEPWQRKPYNARDEADEDNFRQNFLKMMMSLVQASYRRYLAENSLTPDIAGSDPNASVSTRESIRGSTLLDLQEQGVIWLSLLLSSRDPSVQQFQTTVLDGLEEDPSLSAKQARKKVRKYNIEKQARTKQATDLIVETENEFGALVKNLDVTVPKNTDSREYYERLLAKYREYLKGQMPRTLDLSKAGETTTFFVLSPRFGDSTPLEKDVHYKRTTEEAKKKTVTARDVRYQGVYVIRVTPLDSRGESYHLACFWLYLRINDPEIYVPRDPSHALTSAGGWDLHHMPPAELSNEGLVSPATEWMEVQVRHGKLVIVKGQSTFLQRRATSIDLSQTPIDRVQPAQGDIDPTPPRFALSAHDYARVNEDFSKTTSARRDIQAPKLLLDQMPTVPARYEFPDTPEGEQAYQQALTRAISPVPSEARTAHEPSTSGKAPATETSAKQTASQTTQLAKAAATETPAKQAASQTTQLAKAAPPTDSPVPSSLPISSPVPEEMLDPGKMHLEFGSLPLPAEAWLKTAYTAPTPIQQERLKLALYWIAQFLSDAKARHTKSEALQLLLTRLPGKIYCVNNQSIRLAFPVTGNFVIAGLKNTFDGSLPDLAVELLEAMEAMVYQFGKGQPNAQEYRSEIRKSAEQYFSSQPLDSRTPDPFLLAERTPSPTPEQWRLLTSAQVWDCPNPYRFFEAKRSTDDEEDDGFPAKLDPDTVGRLKVEKAAVTELGLDGVFNKDKQGNSRNDQGALLPLGLLFQLMVKEPAGLLLIARAEENERILAANAARAGDTSTAEAHVRTATQIAGTLETVRTLRTAVPNAYLDLYLIKSAPEKRASATRVPAAVSTSADPAGAAWRSRWILYKDRWTLIAGVRQSDIPINTKLLEPLAAALNEKLPAGASALPALQLLKDSIQHSSDPQYGSYASMFGDMDRIETAPPFDRVGTTKP